MRKLVTIKKLSGTCAKPHEAGRPKPVRLGEPCEPWQNSLQRGKRCQTRRKKKNGKGRAGSQFIIRVALARKGRNPFPRLRPPSPARSEPCGRAHTARRTPGSSGGSSPPGRTRRTSRPPAPARTATWPGPPGRTHTKHNSNDNKYSHVVVFTRPY